MAYVIVLLVVACTFGLCYVIDKIFNKLFRNKTQHKSGMCVKASKRYATFGLVLAALGVAALISSNSNRILILIAGIVMILLGLALIIYYLGFGIYYDEESFIYSTFGRKCKIYKYGDIKTQQLYYSGANVVIELLLTDGFSIQLQSTMDGIYGFMNKAFSGGSNRTINSLRIVRIMTRINIAGFPAIRRNEVCISQPVQPLLWS